jgi:hypothetical protein
MYNSYWNMEKKDGPTKVMERDNIITNNLGPQDIGKCQYSWILQSISKSSAKNIFFCWSFVYNIEFANVKLWSRLIIIMQMKTLETLWWIWTLHRTLSIFKDKQILFHLSRKMTPCSIYIQECMWLMKYYKIFSITKIWLWKRLALLHWICDGIEAWTQLTINDSLFTNIHIQWRRMKRWCRYGGSINSTLNSAKQCSCSAPNQILRRTEVWRGPY